MYIPSGMAIIYPNAVSEWETLIKVSPNSFGLMYYFRQALSWEMPQKRCEGMSYKW